MAQIPLGNFGYSQPEVRRSRAVSTRVEDNSAGLITEQIGRAANEFKEAVSLQADLQARKKKADASTKLMEYETKLQEVGMNLDKAHTEGAIKSDALTGAWEQAEKQLREELEPFASELDETTKADFYARREAIRVNKLSPFQNAALNATRKDLQSSLLESGEAFRKANLGNAVAAEAYVNGEFGAELDRAFGPEAGEYKRKFIEQANLDSVNLAITKAGDDPRALSWVLNQLGSEETQARLDPDRLIAIRSSLTSRIDSINERNAAKAEREMLKREMAASSSVEKTMEFITQGNVLSTEAIMQVESETKGTSKEGVAKNLLMYQDGIKKILDAPEAQRTAYIEQRRREMAEKGSTPERLAEFKMLENAVKQRTEMEKSDPHYAYEVKTGSDRVTVDPDSDTVNVAIAEREARARQAGTPDLLRPSERKLIAERITTGSPDQRLGEITKLTSKLSPQQAIKVMGEAGAEKEAGYSAYAGMLVAKGKQSEALSVLKGDEIIKAGAEGYVSKNKFIENLPQSFNEAFKHDEVARKNAIEVAYRAYLSGVTPGQEAENNLAADAESVVGSVIGQTAQVGRAHILVPDGYDPDQFEETLQYSFAKAKQSLGLQGDVDDYQYRPVVDRQTGKTVYRIDVDGKPLGENPIYLSVD